MKTILLFSFLFTTTLFIKAQEIEIKSIKVQTNTTTFGPITEDLQFNAYRLPNNSSSIKRIEFEIEYTAPASYDRSYANIIHTLKLWSYSTRVSLSDPVIELGTYTTSTYTGTYTLIFDNLNIPLRTDDWEYSFIFVSQLNDPTYNFKKTILNSKQFKFYRYPVPETITGNTISRGQQYNVGTYPHDPDKLIQMAGTTLIIEDNSSYSFQWQNNQYGTWTNISLATNESYDPDEIYYNTSYRRVVTTSTGLVSISNEIEFTVELCQTDKNLLQNRTNTICGTQIFYNLKDRDVVYPQTLVGSLEYPDGEYNREYGFDWEMSYDQQNWTNVKGREKIDYSKVDEEIFTSLTLELTNLFLDLFFNFTIKIGDIDRSTLDQFNYHPNPIEYNTNSGRTQKIFFRRKYSEFFKDCNADICLNPFGADWHLRSTSNIVTIILTDQAPMYATDYNITSNTNQTMCHSNNNNGQQTIILSMAKDDLPSGLNYTWEVPNTFYTQSATTGTDLKTIVIAPKEIFVNNRANYTAGGDICVTVSNSIESRRTCYRIWGTTPFSVNLPTTVSVCEGNTVDLTPVINESVAAANPGIYNYSWTAYNTPTKYCVNPSGSSLFSCTTLRVKSENSNFNPKQDIGVIAINQYGCAASALTTMISTPGWQYGVLKSFSDPQYKWNSGLAYDASNNHLYYTANNNKYYRVAYNNSTQFWEYQEVVTSNGNSLDITGSVYVKTGNIERIYYVSENNNNELRYIEKSTNGLIWNKNSNPLANNSDPFRLKYNNGFIYSFNFSNRELNKIDIATEIVTRIPNTRLNYSQGSFTVEEDVVAFADESNNIVALNTNTLQSYIINIPSNKKVVSWNSTISVYNGNIYYVNNGKIIIIKRDASNVYSSFEEIPYTNMEGNFTLNKQTGTIYAKNYNGNYIFQLFYLNNSWNMVEIKPYAGNGSTAVTRNMIYANGHVYYLSNANVIANTFYIPPCYPSQLRQIGEDTGDPMNDPLSKNEGNIITLSVYPNPATSKINISYTNTIEGNMGIRILDIYGKEVYYNSTFEYKGSITQEITLENLSSGLYIIELLQNNTTVGTTKFIKQ